MRETAQELPRSSQEQEIQAPALQKCITPCSSPHTVRGYFSPAGRPAKKPAVACRNQQTEVSASPRAAGLRTGTPQPASCNSSSLRHLLGWGTRPVSISRRLQVWEESKTEKSYRAGGPVRPEAFLPEQTFHSSELLPHATEATKRTRGGYAPEASKSYPWEERRRCPSR